MNIWTTTWKDSESKLWFVMTRMSLNNNWWTCTINRMIHVYRTLLENLWFQTFSELHEAAKRSTTTTPALMERTRATKIEEPRETLGIARRLINKQYNLQPSMNVADGSKRKTEAQQHKNVPPTSHPTKASRKDNQTRNSQAPTQHQNCNAPKLSYLLI